MTLRDLSIAVNLGKFIQCFDNYNNLWIFRLSSSQFLTARLLFQMLFLLCSFPAQIYRFSTENVNFLALLPQSARGTSLLICFPF